MNAPSPALVAHRPERLRLVGQRRQILAVMHQRLMFGMLVFAGVVALVALRILWLAAFGDHAGRKVGLTALIPERGDIVDRDGQPLARTIDAWTISVHPGKIIGDKLAIARRLASLMPERTEDQYFAILKSRMPFFYLRRRASPALVEAVNALGEPGLAIEREPDRLYPQTSLAAHVIGFTDIDGHGVAGMERAFDQRLADYATRGEPLVLSIDSRVQQALEHELLEAMTHFSAIGAAGVVMDIHTGEVLAMTSLPQLNPNAAGQAPPEARFNRATLGVYEMGSTFKPFTVAMAMDSGIIKSFGQVYNCPHELHVYGHVVHDTHPYGRACTVAEIMKESSNIGTAQIADQIGADAAEGLPQEDGIPRSCRDRIEGAWPDPDPGSRWGPFETMTVGFGHAHCGHAAAPRVRLCDLVQRRDVPAGDAAQGRPATIRPAPGQQGVHRRHQLPDARAAAPGGHAGHRAGRPTRRAIASAARPAPHEKLVDGHYTSAVVTRASRVCSRWTSPAM